MVEDSVSVDRLKPIFSTIPVVPAVYPTCGGTRHHSCLLATR
jgi:hypothetical protein